MKNQQKRYFVVALLLAFVALELAVWQHIRVRYVEKELADGAVYRGEWSRGMKQGKGEILYADGGRFTGSFNRDTIQGYGELYRVDGSIFKGMWVDGVRCGEGRLCMPDSVALYRGKWMRDELVNGRLSTDSMLYEGDFRDLQPHGEGVMTRNDGDVYAGGWNCGVRSGVGRLSNESQKRFSFGYWRADTLCVPEGMKYEYGDRVYGIDVSHHQKQIAWGDLAIYCDHQGEIAYRQKVDTTFLQPVWFVLIKSTEGATYQDPHYRENVAKAQMYGIAKGSYHFMTLKSEIPDQVNNYIRNTVWNKGDFPPVLDVEVAHEQVLAIGKECFQEKVLLWLESIEAYYGVRPIIYTYGAYRREYLNSRKFRKYDFWLARYSDKRPKKKDWVMWQFSDSGRVSGIEPLVDLNLYDGDLADMREYLVNCQ